jgi:hypothetical protein
MYMFTTGQSTRMNALFATGGARASLLTSPGLRTGGATASIPTAAYTLYPNPATDVLTLQGSTAARSASAASLSVMVYDIHGLPMRNVRYDATNGQLNVRDLKKGLYRLTINNGQEVIQQSFIKE